jgi:hypothetical protein
MRKGAELIYTRRLKDVYWPDWVDEIARDRRIDHVKPEPEYRQMSERTRLYDIQRVRFFMNELRAARELDPVVIDNTCSFAISAVHWGMPFIDDGNHRFIAYVLLDREWMVASLSGLVIHHEWLRGERDDFVDPDRL